MATTKVTCGECDGVGRVTAQAQPCHNCAGQGRVLVVSHDRKRSNLESDYDLHIDQLMGELADARAVLQRLEKMLKAGSFQAAKNLVDSTLSTMRPLQVRRG